MILLAHAPVDFALIVVGIGMNLTVAAQQKSLPSFESSRVAAPRLMLPAKIERLDTETKAHFDECIRDDAARWGPDFAGHSVIV
jgi:hypothetical protein